MKYKVVLHLNQYVTILDIIDPQWRHNATTADLVLTKHYPSTMVRDNLFNGKFEDWKFHIFFADEDEYIHFSLTYL